ncbi:MAG: threonine/homoserine/homoserine lactone efflux protein [Parvibaculaceae bacterium]|jgi:threonine/homoserine/homoserine lactone efflux protein
MDFLTLLVSGILVGIAVAAPIGPVNLICIRRALRYGWLNGFLAGLGAAAGDGIFAIIAAFSVTAALDFMQSNEVWLQSIGGLFLIGVGTKTWFSHPHLVDGEPQDPTKRAKDHDLEGLLAGVTSSFFLTITNPATMLGFVAIFGSIAGFTLGGTDYVRATELVIAVILGSALWWAALTSFVAYFRRYMNDRALERINRGSAILIALLGLGILMKLIYMFATQ